jgi:hypothetical protein
VSVHSGMMGMAHFAHAWPDGFFVAVSPATVKRNEQPSSTTVRALPVVSGPIERKPSVPVTEIVPEQLRP